MEFLLKLMKQEKLMDRVTRLLLLWVHNHFLDFETNSKMMEYLEEFETLLGPNEKSGKLRLLIFACAEKAKQRTVILTRPSKDEPLHFTLMGGHERGMFVYLIVYFFIFAVCLHFCKCIGFFSVKLQVLVFLWKKWSKELKLPKLDLSAGIRYFRHFLLANAPNYS